MPILDDIMDHEVLGRERKRGIALGREEGREQGREVGREEGRAEGLLEGERQVILRQMGKRFGKVPVWAKERLDALSSTELEQTGLKLLDAVSLEELLGEALSACTFRR